MQEIITPSQVAALLQVHVKTVYRLAEQGVIPGRKIGRRWRFSKKTILGLVGDGLVGDDANETSTEGQLRHARRNGGG